MSVSSRDTLVSHRDWISKDKLHPLQGCSLLVKRGKVRSIFLMSELNPAPEYVLERDLVDQIIALIPVGRVLRVFGE